MTEVSKIQIAVASDCNMLDAALVVCGSAMQHASRDVHLIFMGYEFEKHQVERVEILCRKFGADLSFIGIKPDMFGRAKRHNEHISLMSLARLYLPQFASGRVIYLDCDMLVQDDIAELFDFDLKGAPLGVVRDHLVLRRLARGNAPDSKKLSEFSTVMKDFPVQDYFNAGLLVMDCDHLTENQELLDQMQDVSRVNEYRYYDQDHLNIVFAGKTCFLPLRWNLTWNEARKSVSYFQALPFLEPTELQRLSNPGNAHFTGAYKPWKRLTLDMVIRGRLTIILAYRRAARILLARIQ